LPYSFRYFTPAPPNSGEDVPVTELEFSVRPESRPPSNVHVVIGRNGVGKSFLLNNMTNVLVRGEDPESGSVQFDAPADETQARRFANVVSVAFSAFDEFEPLRRQSHDQDRLKYSYIGLKVIAKSGDKPQSPKGYTALARIFHRMAVECWCGFGAVVCVDTGIGV